MSVHIDFGAIDSTRYSCLLRRMRPLCRSYIPCEEEFVKFDDSLWICSPFFNFLCGRLSQSLEKSYKIKRGIPEREVAERHTALERE
ncbi:Uncharacterized protein APZ42_013345 [Daphnia magna]|uniref:Uncharacterized protein n=1 Tax=Daphnia magna TaxID=35525 RepID=A0A162QWH2_9CRUS|nr:Uncharacterized protein APZ42_013345 [Daphnia magna]